MIGFLSPVLLLWLALQPIEQDISYLCFVEYKNIQDRIGQEWPEHPVLKDGSLRLKISKAVLNASVNTGLDTELILAVAWKESHFDPNIISLKKRGKVGEKGLMQTHGVAARGCNLETIDGQIQCGSKWLAHNIEKCGSVLGGLSRYMTGKNCKPIRPAKKRMKLYRKLGALKQ